LGNGAGYKSEDGNDNIFLGNNAGYENVHGSGNVFIGKDAGRLETGSDKLYIANNNSASPLLYGDFASKILVVNGTAAHDTFSLNFYVNGTAGGVSGWSQASDARMKKEVASIPDALEKVMKLNGVYYYWNNEQFDPSRQIGFIAQEVEKILPEVVNNSQGNYSMQYAPVTALLVEALKQQQKMIDDLKAEVEKLKNASERDR
jgi:hypothetical protein